MQHLGASRLSPNQMRSPRVLPDFVEGLERWREEMVMGRCLEAHMHTCVAKAFKQCFSTRVVLSPKGHLAVYGDTSGCLMSGCYWHQVGGGQRCC